jgi:hypothetical protein
MHFISIYDTTMSYWRMVSQLIKLEQKLDSIWSKEKLETQSSSLVLLSPLYNRKSHSSIVAENVIAENAGDQ